MTGPQQYVTRRGANHTLHIILSILTCGLWAITGWPIAAAIGRRTHTTVYPGQQPGQYPPPGQPQYGPPQGWQQPQGQQPPPPQWGPR